MNQKCMFCFIDSVVNMYIYTHVCVRFVLLCLFTNLPIQYAPFGCYVDSPSNRLLTGKSLLDDPNLTAKVREAFK